MAKYIKAFGNEMTNKTTSEIYYYRVNHIEVVHLCVADYKYYILKYLIVVVDGYTKYADTQEFWRPHD